MKKMVANLRVFFSVNRVRNLVVHPIYYLGYVITINLKCQTSRQPTPTPPPIGHWAIWRGGGVGKETADTSDYNCICLIAIWNESVSTSLSTRHLLFSP